MKTRLTAVLFCSLFVTSLTLTTTHAYFRDFALPGSDVGKSPRRVTQQTQYKRNVRRATTLAPRYVEKEEVDEMPKYSAEECAKRNAVIDELWGKAGSVLRGQNNIVLLGVMEKLFTEAKCEEEAEEVEETDTESEDQATDTEMDEDAKKPIQIACKGIRNRTELEQCLLEQRRQRRNRLKK